MSIDQKLKCPIQFLFLLVCLNLSIAHIQDKAESGGNLAPPCLGD